MKIEENFNINKENEINIILNNYPPKNNEELSKVKEGLITLYNKKNNNNDNKNNKINNYCEIYQKVLINELKDCENYFIKFKYNNVLNFKAKFEWSSNSYSQYGFCYKLEENNSKITKILDTNITLCKASKELEKGYKYKLDYFIDYIYGEFDIGIGDISINNTSNGLTIKKCYYVSN